MFYLNHVGYKDKIIHLSSKKYAMFYLNHVGYKESFCNLFTVFLVGFI